ncbi:hypothetical protein G6F31_012558 [Rhizopus arrhizus]|nr:hypothetical protein G6F31_012558 [Rhizopus arrhizus]
MSSCAWAPASAGESRASSGRGNRFMRVPPSAWPVHVLVVGAHDQGHDHGDEAGGGHPPDVPDQREAQHQDPDVEDQRHAGVLRHVDRRVLLRRRWQATLLRFVEGVQLIGLGHHGEVVERRRRRRGPFQRACIPRVAGQVGGLLAVADRHGHLDDLAQDAGADDEGTCSGHQQQRLVGRVDGALQTTGHAHEAQHVHRHEGHVEADEPAPERALAPELIEAEAEHLRPPVGDAGEHAEHHAADDDVVEVGDQEQAVVQHEVDGRDRQHHAGHAADGEGDHEADGPQHGRGELHATAEHGEQPVEDLHAGRDRDDHRRDAEEGIDAGTGAHGEEVVQPDDERQDADRQRGAHHRLVAEQLLARERGGDFREDAERRQHQDVHLRMAPGPHQVHVHHRVATQRVGVEVEVQVAVQGERAQRHGEDREGGDDDHAGDQYRPGEHRHLHQGHARRTHAQDGDEQVDAGQQCSDTGGLQRPDVVVDTHPWTELDTRQRRIGDPAGHGEFANTQRDHHQRGAAHEAPEAEGVEERERHVARADLQRHDHVHQPQDQGRGHEEDHDDAMRREDLVVVVRRQVAGGVAHGHGLLGAHHDGVGKAAQQHDQRDDDVHHADALVVDGGQPFRPEVLPLAEVSDCAEDR